MTEMEPLPAALNPASKGTPKSALLLGESGESTLILLQEPLLAYHTCSKCRSLYNSSTPDADEEEPGEETAAVLSLSQEGPRSWAK